MKIQIPEILIEQGWISKRKHPKYNYFIYNYSPKTQYQNYWNEYTLMCRGLILDKDGFVIARPWKKFFNYDDYLGDIPQEFDNSPFEVYEKLDGSLIILYYLPNGEAQCATRGSFESEQAILATQILKEKYSTYEFDDEYTFLFELIAPENRIVVDYGDTRDLFLLGAIHRETGEEAPYELLQEYSLLMGVPLMKKYPFKNFNELLERVDNQEFQNEEGYVVRFNTGLRVKVKFAEYKRIHRLTYQFRDSYLWELLSTEQCLEEIYKNIPNEYLRPIQERALSFYEDYKNIEQEAVKMVEKYAGVSRKDFALAIQNYEHRSVCFAMINEKDYKQIIWKLLKP